MASGTHRAKGITSWDPWSLQIVIRARLAAMAVAARASVSASRTSEILKNPRPPSPKATPGVTTTPSSFINVCTQVQSSTPAGTGSHTYIDAGGAVIAHPAAASAATAYRAARNTTNAQSTVIELQGACSRPVEGAPSTFASLNAWPWKRNSNRRSFPRSPYSMPQTDSPDAT